MWKLKCAVAVTAAITRRIQIDTQAKMFREGEKDGILMQLVSFHSMLLSRNFVVSVHYDEWEQCENNNKRLGHHQAKQPSVIPIDFNS